MKKVISALLVVLCTFSLCFSSYAAQGENQYDASDKIVIGYLYTDADYQNLSEKEQLAEETAQKLSLHSTTASTSPSRVIPSAKTYTIPIENFKQEKTNWCGAACVKQTLSFHRSVNGVSTALPSQGTIATKLGIYSSGGASSDKMAQVLNEYRSTYGFTNRTYSTADLTDKSDAYNWLYPRLRSAIVNQTYAPIVLLETGRLSGIQRYYEAGEHCRHYNTIGGIRETTDLQNNHLYLKEIQTVDPHYNSQFYGKHWDEGSTVYQSMLLADSNGANKVLIY
ncbi:MAG: C39 family peptidase [Lachnospiraceae bacterium]